MVSRDMDHGCERKMEQDLLHISLACLGIKPLETRWYRPVLVSKQGNVVIYDQMKRLFRCYQRTDTICQIFSRTCVISPYFENMVQLHNEQVDLRTEIACSGNTCFFKVNMFTVKLVLFLVEMCLSYCPLSYVLYL